MNNEDKQPQIAAIDFKVIADFFKELERQGPGGDEETRRAAALAFGEEGMNRPLRIADMGCGTGHQTAVLAKALPNATIVGVDLLPEKVDYFTRRMRRENLSDRVTALLASMDDTPFEPESLDGIWAEGAIYNVGYETGLRCWHRLLKPHGVVAVTDTVWLSDRRPAEPEWLLENMPEIDTVENKCRQMKSCGYRVKGSLVLPSYCWTDNYYAPMPARIAAFRKEYAGNDFACMLADGLEVEMEYYRRYGDCYGYAFIIGEKRG